MRQPTLTANFRDSAGEEPAADLTLVQVAPAASVAPEVLLLAGGETQ
jgi:hypothetical protein